MPAGDGKTLSPRDSLYQISEQELRGGERENKETWRETVASLQDLTLSLARVVSVNQIRTWGHGCVDAPVGGSQGWTSVPSQNTAAELLSGGEGSIHSPSLEQFGSRARQCCGASVGHGDTPGLGTREQGMRHAAASANKRETRRTRNAALKPAKEGRASRGDIRYGTKLTYGLNFPFDLESFQRKDKLPG